MFIPTNVWESNGLFRGTTDTAKFAFKLTPKTVFDHISNTEKRVENMMSSADWLKIVSL